MVGTKTFRLYTDKQNKSLFKVMNRHIYFLLGLILITGCSNEEVNIPVDDVRQVVTMSLLAENGVISDEIEAGLYMVNYFNGAEDKLLPTGNYVNNMMIVYENNGWQLETPIYWYDETTPADFYVYAPYDKNVPDACALSFSVATDQTSVDRMAEGDFLWGASKKQSPSAGGFELKMQHHFSKMTVVITADSTLSDLTAEDVSVAIGGTITSATINLQTGDITPTGEAQDVTCYNNGDLSYTSILIPQQVPFSNFIKIDWNDSPYTLQSAFKLESRKEYRLTVRLKKTAGGFDIGIDGWEISDEDFGGIVGGI